MRIKHIQEAILGKKYSSAGGYLWFDKNAIKRYKSSIIQYNKKGKYINLTEIVNQLNINKGHVSECAKGKRKSANGYIWKYKT